ncbi:hypothetical protein [uncultured Algibacter sp.]|uniref:hypothetical protein n=1 Tax=uncultured Algibacter sp. TaxID=298659 RepID=UPI003216643C
MAKRFFSNFASSTSFKTPTAKSSIEIELSPFSLTIKKSSSILKVLVLSPSKIYAEGDT